MTKQTWVAIAATTLSALMLWASSPAVGISLLAWVALVPAASVVLGYRGMRVARLAIPLTYALYLELLLVPALPFGLTDGQWGDPPLPVLVGGSPMLAVALLAIPLFGAVLYAIRFGDPEPRRGPAVVESLTWVLIPALAWTALDFVRVKLDPGGFWGPLFLTQADTAAGDLAALAGPWLITASIVAVNYGLALALATRRAVVAVIPVVAVVALVLIGSQAGPAGADVGGDGLSVAAVQPGYDTAEKDRAVLRDWEPDSYDVAALDVIGDLAGLTRGATRRGADLVVWPEASMFVDPRSEPAVKTALRRVARATNATLIVPYFDEARSRSAALAVVPGPGRAALITDSRPKQRPMWFLGEEGGGEPPPEPLRLAGLRVGTLLGVDTQDPGVARELSDSGAMLLASATHDWPALAIQQGAFARLAARAVGTPLVRADWRYGSAIYGRDGVELAGAGSGRRRTVVVAEVTPGSPTPYARVGDALGWFALAIFLMLGAVSVMRAARLHAAGIR